MATRFKASDLREVIRQVVKEEIHEVVLKTINEVLSERYMRQLAEAAVNNRPRGVATLDIQGDDEEPDEETPHALSNDILGVGQRDRRFQKNPSSKQVRQHEGVDRNAMLSLFFEGTKPLDAVEAEQEEGIPPQALNEAAEGDMSRWKQTVDATAQLAEQRREIRPDPEAEEARLKRLREDLDRRVVG